MRLALLAHDGQKDWNGRPFILHPIRVMQGVARYGEEVMTAALLHDSVEDSEGRVTNALIEAQVGYDEAKITGLLTHISDLPYTQYIKSLYAVDDWFHRSAVRIKLADLADNIDPTRLLVRDDHESRVLAKHAKALQELRELGWQ